MSQPGLIIPVGVGLIDGANNCTCYCVRIINWIYIMEIEKKEVQEESVHFGKFNIFLLTKTAQNAYGMKNGDYARYRLYCSHKVFKLRQSLGLKLGNKTKFIRKDFVKEKPNESKTLQLLLFNAEKNWAFANETKFSQIRKPSQKSRARFFSAKKLKKALDWTRQLRKLCAQKTENISQLEAHAYELFLEGSLEFEMQRWANAQSKLIACREIMSDIGKVSDSLSEKVFKQKIDQIEQTIKFCNFKISKGKELSITEIVELRKGGDASLSNLIDSLTEKRLGEIKIGQTGGEVHFGNERYPIKEEAIIKKKASMENSLANIEQIKQKWFSSLEDDNLYEELLSLYSTLIIEIEEAIHLCDSEQSDPKKKEKYTQGELEILKKVSFLFTEIKMKAFIDRNLVVFRYSNEINRGRKSSPQTIAKLLTATMSLFQQLGEVVKQKGQISNSFQIQQIQAIDAKNFYLRAMRLLFIGQVYFNNSKLKQAFGLWNECERCIKILLSKEEMNENKDDEKFIGSLMPLSRILEQVRASRCKCLILNYESEEAKKDDLNKNIGKIDLSENADNSKVISTSLERLITDSREGDSKLTLEEISQIPIVELPGRPQPIPTRPIFFDIYYHGLAYPEVESKIKKATATKSTSWWGRIFK